MADRETNQDMTDAPVTPKRRKKRIRRIIVSLLILVGAGIAVAAIVDQVRLRLALARCQDLNP
ncbi:MAG TPA: hypothetical protein VLM89_03555, partial [Phycisphaerae bacterium]|nr:hypothetical protein [Phycisphaerae bacterium]